MHTTSNLVIRLNGKMVLYCEDLANPKIRLYLVSNPLPYQNHIPEEIRDFFLGFIFPLQTMKCVQSNNITINKVNAARSPLITVEVA